MSLVIETRALRRKLSELASSPEWALLTRYDLLTKKPPVSLKERVWRCIRRVLASLGVLSPHVTQYPWRPSLKHAQRTNDANVLLIWALGAERDALRAACVVFSNRLKNRADVAPVLVTDVADFAYFSRLGWLIEYLPELSGEGPSYKERKYAYLAWRYRETLIVPWRAGLASEKEWNALLKVDWK